MKKLLLAALLLTTAPVMANDYCTQISKLAKTVMGVRQSGVDMPTVMGLAEKYNSEIGKQIVIDAYETPRFTVDSYIQRHVKEFSNEWYLQCLKAER